MTNASRRLLSAELCNRKSESQKPTPSAKLSAIMTPLVWKTPLKKSAIMLGVPLSRETTFGTLTTRLNLKRKILAQSTERTWSKSVIIKLSMEPQLKKSSLSFSKSIKQNALKLKRSNNSLNQSKQRRRYST